MKWKGLSININALKKHPKLNSLKFKEFMVSQGVKITSK